MTIIKVRFLDHTLSATAHGELRLFEKSIISFAKSQHEITPRSISDLHTIITFGNASSDSSSSSPSPNSRFSSSTSNSDSTTVVFCFRDSEDTAAVFENPHECNSFVSQVKQIKTERKDFVHLRYPSLQDVAQYLFLREGAPRLKSQDDTIPFPHTRLDFLKLAQNRSVQCRLSNLGDSRLELSCDGVQICGLLSLNPVSNLSLQECCEMRNNNNSSNDSSNQTTTTTMVVILSNQAIYVTENNGRVVGRIAFEDITEVKHLPEISSLFLYDGSRNEEGEVGKRGGGGGGTLLTSRFCPEIFARITMSGRLVKCYFNVNNAAATSAAGGGDEQQENQTQLQQLLSSAASPPQHSQNHPHPHPHHHHNHSSSRRNNNNNNNNNTMSPQLERIISTCEFATQTEDDDETNLQKKNATTFFWMNQATRLQEVLSKRDVELNLLRAAKHQQQQQLHQLQHHFVHSSSSKEKTQQQQQHSAMFSSMHRELEVLRHYTRMLEDEITDFKESELQQRIIELSKELLLVNNNNNNNKEENSDVVVDVVDENSMKALKIALLDSQRQQTSLTRKCDRIQSELQSVMINTDAALKELTSFVAAICSEETEILPFDQEEQEQEESDRDSQEEYEEEDEEEDEEDDEQVVRARRERRKEEKAESKRSTKEEEKKRKQQQQQTPKTTTGGGVGRRRIRKNNVQSIVDEAVARLEEQLEAKVQSETAVRVAELKAMNASLVVELRDREQQLEKLTRELNSAASSSSPSSYYYSSNNNNNNNNNNNMNSNNLVASVSAQQNADSKHRSLSRHVTDLEQLRDQLKSEIGHLLESADAQSLVHDLQHRIAILEQLHQFPLLINRVASLEAIASTAEETKLYAQELKKQLDEKNNLLSRRSSIHTNLQSETDSLKKKIHQLEHAATKEVNKREELERKMTDNKVSHQNEVKELRKQVRYHQLRVQELLKRIASSPSSSSKENHKKQQQQQEEDDENEQNKEYGDLDDDHDHHHHHHPHVTVISPSSMPRTYSSSSSSSSSSSPHEKQQNQAMKNLDQNRKKTPTTKTATFTSSSTAASNNKTTLRSSFSKQLSSTSSSSSSNNRPNSARTKTPVVSAAATSAAAAAAGGGGDASPENFGVIEDPVKIAQTRFAQVAAKKRFM